MTVFSDLRCTCLSEMERSAHFLACELWDDPDFNFGTAVWDPVKQCLVEASYDEIPNPFTYDRSDLKETHMAALATSIKSDIVSTAASDTISERLDLIRSNYSGLIVTTAGRRFSELNGAVSGLVNKDGKQYPDCDDLSYLAAEEYLGADFVALVKKMSTPKKTSDPDNPDYITNDDIKEIEGYATLLHTQKYQQGYPFYDCMCKTKSSSYCADCGVQRCRDGKEPDPWVPTYGRRVREFQMHLLDQQYDCTCPNSKGSTECGKCGVQRWWPTDPWTYWDKPKTYGGTGTSTSTTWQKCRHYGMELTLPDKTKITASSEFKRKDDDKEKPDFGIYFYTGWKPNWLSYQLNWPDYGVPDMPMEHVLMAVDDGLARARAGQRIEIGCMGGHGRTGTFLALMLLKAGVKTPAKAIAWVHKNYCTEAIESDKQEWYIKAVHAFINGKPIPAMPKVTTSASTGKNNSVCTPADHRVQFLAGKECDCNFWLPDSKPWLKDTKMMVERSTAIGKNGGKSIVVKKADVKTTTVIGSPPKQSSSKKTPGSTVTSTVTKIQWTYLGLAPEDNVCLLCNNHLTMSIGNDGRWRKCWGCKMAWRCRDIDQDGKIYPAGLKSDKTHLSQEHFEVFIDGDECPCEYWVTDKVAFKSAWDNATTTKPWWVTKGLEQMVAGKRAQVEETLPKQWRSTPQQDAVKEQQSLLPGTGVDLMKMAQIPKSGNTYVSLPDTCTGCGQRQFKDEYDQVWCACPTNLEDNLNKVLDEVDAQKALDDIAKRRVTDEEPTPISCLLCDEEIKDDWTCHCKSEGFEPCPPGGNKKAKASKATKAPGKATAVSGKTSK